MNFNQYDDETQKEISTSDKEIAKTENVVFEPHKEVEVTIKVVVDPHKEVLIPIQEVAKQEDETTSPKIEVTQQINEVTKQENVISEIPKEVEQSSRVTEPMINENVASEYIISEFPKEVEQPREVIEPVIKENVIPEISKEAVTPIQDASKTENTLAKSSNETPIKDVVKPKEVMHKKFVPQPSSQLSPSLQKIAETMEIKTHGDLTRILKVEFESEEEIQKDEFETISAGGNTFIHWTKAHFKDSNIKKPIATMRNVNVTFGFGESAVHAMKNVSINLYENEVLGLVGESGSGKTTTGRALVGVQGINAGQIAINGTLLPMNPNEIKGKVKKEIINNVQMIFQDPADSLNPQKTIYKVASEGLDNIDIKKNFLTLYTTETIEHITRMIKKPLAAHDSSVITRFKNEEKWEKLIEKVYDEAIEELKSSEEKNAHLAITYLRAKENEARLVATASRKSLETIKRRIIVDLLQSVGLDEQVLNRFPLEFSGGQQQRIGIVRAIAMRPRIIVADEPISALDVSIQAQVINILNDLKDKYKLSIVFIAHDLRMVEYISDRIAIMYRGEIVEIGHKSEIMKNPIHPYTKMLLKSIPSIDKIHKNLSAKYYNPADYMKEHEEKVWFQVKGNNHFVFAGRNELINFFASDEKGGN